MTVTLESISFNHDTGSHHRDALNIRRNVTTEVTRPEWRRGATVNPEDSPAAYARAAVGSNTVTVVAVFSAGPGDPSSVQVRAVDNVVVPPDPPGCLGWFIGLIRRILRALFGNVLGEPQERTVTFAAGGTSGPVEFTLAYTRLATARVGVYTTEWRWQYRAGQGGWTDMDVTRHRVYVLLDVPTAPWQQQPFAGNTQVPWTEVLDVACQWGFFADTKHEAAAKVTASVHGLGPGTVTYDCPGGGGTRYASGFFNCTAFLDRLRGGTGNGYYVNCSDCATFTSTFANVLGADLSQSRMEGWFELNPILAIGSSTWQTACGWGGFGYHEVAWTGSATANDNVYDACLQVDDDADPSHSPHSGVLPTNMRFGNPGDGDYRDKLCTAAGSPNCQPNPPSAKRRSVG